MIDKQIIIDGVDVNGCLFYQTNFEEDYDVKIKHYCSNWHNSCESNNNSSCYYKQLARAEQENKRLLEIINANPLETVDMDCAFEIEKLKEQLKRKEQKLDKIQTICEKETTKSTFCNGIENKDLQKLAIKILKIIERKDNE